MNPYFPRLTYHLTQNLHRATNFLLFAGPFLPYPFINYYVVYYILLLVHWGILGNCLLTLIKNRSLDSLARPEHSRAPNGEQKQKYLPIKRFFSRNLIYTTGIVAMAKAYFCPHASWRIILPVYVFGLFMVEMQQYWIYKTVAEGEPL